MKKIQLGVNGPLISQIGLGTMMMGWRLDYDESEKIIETAYNSGIFLIDTSVSYSRGACHEIIGKALRKLNLQKKFFIATKVGGISCDKDSLSDRGYSKYNIIRQCELSLHQLKVDAIDLLQLHHPTKDTPCHEVLDALVCLQEQGKIKNYGLCNYEVKDFENISGCAKKAGLTAPLSNQFEYNLLNFKEKEPLFDLLETIQTATLTWGPLASGLLSNWYMENTQIKPNSRIHLGREKAIKTYLLNKPSTKNLLKHLSLLCSETGLSAQVLALIWILQKKPKNCVLIGPSNISHLNELVSKTNSYLNATINFAILNSSCTSDFVKIRSLKRKGNLRKVALSGGEESQAKAARSSEV